MSFYVCSIVCIAEWYFHRAYRTSAQQMDYTAPILVLLWAEISLIHSCPNSQHPMYKCSASAFDRNVSTDSLIWSATHQTFSF